MEFLGRNVCIGACVCVCMYIYVCMCVCIGVCMYYYYYHDTFPFPSFVTHFYYTWVFYLQGLGIHRYCNAVLVQVIGVSCARQ